MFLLCLQNFDKLLLVKIEENEHTSFKKLLRNFAEIIVQIELYQIFRFLYVLNSVVSGFAWFSVVLCGFAWFCIVSRSFAWFHVFHLVLHVSCGFVRFSRFSHAIQINILYVIHV